MFLEALGDAGGLAGIEAAGRLAAQDLDEEHEYLARPERFELPTYCSGGNRSIQLSYGRATCKFT